jgi:hypothetical protein
MTPLLLRCLTLAILLLSVIHQVPQVFASWDLLVLTVISLVPLCRVTVKNTPTQHHNRHHNQAGCQVCSRQRIQLPNLLHSRLGSQRLNQHVDPQVTRLHSRQGDQVYSLRAPLARNHLHHPVVFRVLNLRPGLLHNLRRGRLHVHRRSRQRYRPRNLPRFQLVLQAVRRQHSPLTVPLHNHQHSLPDSR